VAKKNARRFLPEYAINSAVSPGHSRIAVFLLGDTEATLSGETFAGQSFSGADSIQTVGRKAKKFLKKRHGSSTRIVLMPVELVSIYLFGA